MPINTTTGVFTRVSNSFSEPVDGTIIEATDAEPTFDDWDGGITDAYAWAAPPRIVTAAGAVTVAADDIFIALNKSVAADTDFNLPALSSKAGPVTIWDAAGVFNSFTIRAVPNGADPMMGQATWPMSGQYGKYTFYPTSLGWLVY
jgi:hypothetical protein